MTEHIFSSSVDLWKAYRSLKMDTWGPLRVFGGVPETSTTDVKVLVSKLASFIQELSLSSVEPGSLQPGKRYVVKDAPTAALLLHLDQEVSLLRGNSPPVYRGQAGNPEWSIQASIDRTQGPGQEREHLRQYYGALLFTFMLQSIDWHVGGWMPKDWHLDEYPAMAMARHQGMASPLIDFTVDPSVAVIFAHEQAESASSKMGSVFRFTVDDFGNDVILSLSPPPFLRSARQHGIYYHSIVESDSTPRAPQISSAANICFPTDSPRILSNGLLRDGEVVDLMHADPLLEAIEIHVRKYMENMPVVAIHDEANVTSARVPHSLRQLGDFSLMMLERDGTLSRSGERFSNFPSGEVMQEWFILTTDILYSLIGIDYGRRTSTARLDLVDRFVRHNYITTQVYLHYYSLIFRNTPLESLLPIVRLINTKLLEVSNGYVGVYSPDLILKGTSIIPGEVRSLPWPSSPEPKIAED